MISPPSLNDPSTFLTGIGSFSFCALLSFTILLSTNSPSAPQSTRAFVSAIFRPLGVYVLIDNFFFDSDCTNTPLMAKSVLSLEGLDADLFPLIENPFQRALIDLLHRDLRSLL